MLLDLRGGPRHLAVAPATVVGSIQAASDTLFGPLRTAACQPCGRAGELEAQLAQLQDDKPPPADDQRSTDPAVGGLPAARRRKQQARAEAAVPARVAADPAPGQAVTLDVGSDGGIVIDSQVLVAGGVVGQVTSVAASASVTLVTGRAALLLSGPWDQLPAPGTGTSTAGLGCLDPLARGAGGDRVETFGSDDELALPGRGSPWAPWRR